MRKIVRLHIFYRVRWASRLGEGKKYATRLRNLVGRFMNNFSKASGNSSSLAREGEKKRESDCAKCVRGRRFFSRFYCVCSATGLIGRAAPGGGGGADGD